jgi:hypothetical protein
MIRALSPLSLAFLLALAFPALGQAVPLAEEKHINEQLIAAQAGDILRKTCPTISARMFVVWQKATALEDYTRAAGYTEEEASAFLKDKAQKARVKAAAMDYLTKAGVVAGDVESYCKVGRDEIAKNTLVGSILWSSK